MMSDPDRKLPASQLAAENDLLRRELDDRDAELRRVQSALDRAQVQQTALQDEVEELASAEGERVREIILLTNLLKAKEDSFDEFARRLAWSAAVHECLVVQPWWWPLLPTRKLRKRQLRRLMAAGLFDHQAYLRRYPDVRDSGMDPLSHYLCHGLEEGRSRSSDMARAKHD
jgi:hypothetical protein